MKLHLALLSIGLLFFLAGANPCLADKKEDCFKKMFGIEVVVRPPGQALSHLEELWKRPMTARKRQALEKTWARIDADRPEIGYPKALSLPKTDSRRRAVESVMAQINKTRRGLSNDSPKRGIEARATQLRRGGGAGSQMGALESADHYRARDETERDSGPRPREQL